MVDELVSPRLNVNYSMFNACSARLNLELLDYKVFILNIFGMYSSTLAHRYMTIDKPGIDCDSSMNERLHHASASPQQGLE